MRIISGKYKSRVIKAPKGQNTRPTSDRVKESIFNILQDKVITANCLDLFAGSGNLGIEALSRQANFCVFVDHDKNAIQVIRENINQLELNKQSKILFLDYKVALKKIDLVFDLIFLDPPYRYEIIFDILKIINERKLLHEKGIVIYESNHENQIKEEQIFDFKVKKYQYGDTIVNILFR